jgi:hypothetical protein
LASCSLSNRSAAPPIRKNRFGALAAFGFQAASAIKVLTAAKQQIRARIAFRDVPEKGPAFGQGPNKLERSSVWRPHTIDRYGRLVARVLVDGRDAGPGLLKQGLC